jgi:adenylate kinase family enzyme
MQEYTIIFIGKSGAGKGTQISRLFTYLEGKGEFNASYLEAGQTLRDFIASGTYTSKIAQSGNMGGKLQPGFLAVWAWANKMITSFTGQKILCVDGAPRKLNEAYILDEMFDFYNRENRIVIHLNVSDDWARERLKERGREDDLKQESVETRLEWFAQNSKDILAYFEDTGKYKTITIHGEQGIDQVHADIINALGL